LLLPSFLYRHHTVNQLFNFDGIVKGHSKTLSSEVEVLKKKNESCCWSCLSVSGAHR